MVLEAPIESIESLILVLAITLLSFTLLRRRFRILLAGYWGLVNFLQELLLVLGHLFLQVVEEFVALSVDAVHLGTIIPLAAIILEVYITKKLAHISNREMFGLNPICG